MPNDVDLHCKVFVDADIARSNLVDIIARRLGETVASQNIVEVGGAEVYVDDNEDFRTTWARTADAPFVYYRYYLDLDPLPGQDLPGQISVVSHLLECLWSQGFSAVAACAFEEDLPRRGGFHEDVPRKD
jgi:hypothetical protein